MVPEDYDRYRMSVKELENYLVFALVVLFICGYVFYKSLVMAVIVSLLAFAGIPWYRRSLAEKKKNELRIQFKDFLYSVSSSVNSGRHLGEAIGDSYEAVSLIHGENAVLSVEIRNMVRKIEDANASEDTVLKDLAVRSHVGEIADFTDICATCRQTGGDLSKMIYKAVYLLTQNIELQKEKEVILSQKKLETRILAAMPVIVTLFINMTSEDYLEVMYTSTAGRIIMTFSLLTALGSFVWSMRMMEGGERAAVR